MSLSYNFGMGTNDNGNVYGVTNNLDGIQPNRPNGSQAYTYDALNRVTLAQTPAAMPDCTVMPSGLTKDWGQSFTYDAWGNLNTIAVSRCSTPSFSASALANNQLGAPYTYDADGNMTFDGTTHYSYNAENQVATAAGVSYTYDGDGERVAKSAGKLYWGGSGTNALDESDSGGNFTEEYVFFGGKRIARIDLPGGAMHYYFSDHLGSASVVTSADGSVIEQESDYYAFGGERAIVSGPNVYKFTGKERDSETGNDYFGARYFGSPMGRWLTPDWSGQAVPVPYAIFTDPQTLNLYSYVRDNPLANADLDGHSPYASICCNFMRGGGEVEQRLDMCSIAGCSGEGAFEQMDVQDSDELRNEMQAEGQIAPTVAYDPQKPLYTPTGVVYGAPSSAFRLMTQIDQTSPAGERQIFYQLADGAGRPFQKPGFSVKEHATVTKVTRGYSVRLRTSNHKFVPASSTGVFEDEVGPHLVVKSATYSYTMRQTFSVKQGANVYSLTTVIEDRVVVTRGIVTSVTTNIVTP